MERLDEAVDLITIDAGWTKLEKILPVIKKFIKHDGIIIALLKPQYEADKKLFKGGVLDQNLSEQTKLQVVEKIRGLGFKVGRIIDSPILGGSGNREYLLLIKP